LSISSLRSGFGEWLEGVRLIAFVSGAEVRAVRTQRCYGSGGRTTVAGPPGRVSETNPWKLAALIEKAAGAGRCCVVMVVLRRIRPTAEVSVSV
jgi:hypothetical protein